MPRSRGRSPGVWRPAQSARSFAPQRANRTASAPRAIASWRRPRLDALGPPPPPPRQAAPVVAVTPRTEQAETLTREPAGPLGAIVFKTTADPFVGRISYVKVVSGVLTSGTPLLNAAKDQPERAGTIGYPKGKTLEPATEVVAGDIAGISKLSVTATGDTLASRDHPLRLPPIEYPEQTFSAAVGAKNKADEEKVDAALVKLVDGDPP